MWIQRVSLSTETHRECERSSLQITNEPALNSHFNYANKRRVEIRW